MTNYESKLLDLLHAWQSLDELAMAQSSTLEKTTKARDAAKAEFLYAFRQRSAEVLR